MAKPFFDLERIDPDGLRRIAGILRGYGYTEKGIRKRLRIKDLCSIGLSSYPYFIQYRLRRRSPLDLAILLFLLQGVITEEELGELFDLQARKLLRVAGVLMGDRASRTFRSRLSLYPVGDKLFFTDHRFQHHGWVRARMPRDPVRYLGGDSYYLARCTLDRPVRNALDLCSGSGIHTILTAGAAERAVGIDLSARAVNFSRLNAMLNDAWNAVFLEGDLFSPVGGERFDLITANPPFVAAPVYKLLYRDGGPSGADVLRRIIASLPDYLSSRGVAQIVTHVAEREGERYLERLRRWLGGANMNLHSLKLGEEDVLDYATAHVRRTFGERYDRYADRLMEWVTNLRAQRFHRVVGVVLTLQWNDEAPHPPWTQEDDVKPPLGPIGNQIGRLLSAKRRARKLTLAELDTVRVGVPDDLVLVERRQPTGGGFQTKEFRVLFPEGSLSPELDIKPLVRDLLERVDNRSTVPEVIGRLSQDTDQPIAQLDERCRRAFLVMFERGLVTMDEVDKPAGVEEVVVGGPGSLQPDDPFLHSAEPIDVPSGVPSGASPEVAAAPAPEEQPVAQGPATIHDGAGSEDED